MGRRVLITGGSGFLGSAVTALFLEQGFDVILLVRKSSSLHRLESFKDNKKLNILFSEDGIDRCFSRPIDYIIHLATCFGRNKDSVADVVFANLYLPILLLEKAISTGCRGFYNADTFFDRKLGLAPREKSYIYTKKTFLEIAKDLLFKTDLKFINMKIEQLYGPSDNENKFVPSIIRQLVSGQPDIDLTKGEQKRDFIFVQDAAKAFLYAVLRFENLDRWEDFGIGTGKSISIKKAVLFLKKLTGSNANLRWGKIPLRKNEIMDSKAATKNNKKFGWKAETSWQKGLNEAVVFFRK